MNCRSHEMIDLGFNYHLNDVLYALGIKQMNKLDQFIKRRNKIAKNMIYFLKNIMNI